MENAIDTAATAPPPQSRLALYRATKYFLGIVPPLLILLFFMMYDQAGRPTLNTVRILMTVSVWGAAMVLAFLTRERAAVLVALGMAFSFLGDLAMMGLLRIFEVRLLNGILGFAPAHICYIIAFRSRAATAPSRPVLLTYGISYLISAALGTPVLLAGRSPQWIIGAASLYSLLLTTTAASATSVLFAPQRNRGLAFLGAAGAWIFFLSDLMIGLNEFVAYSALRGMLIYPVYILGQMGIVASLPAQDKPQLKHLTC